jgi:hypothetical protein
LLGIRQERLIERNFGAHERGELAAALRDFSCAVEVLGPLTSSDRTDAEDRKTQKDAAV